MNTITLGVHTLKFQNSNSYQDIAVVRDVWAQIPKMTSTWLERNWYGREVYVVQMTSIKEKLRVLRKYGTRLLIRVAKALIEYMIEWAECPSVEVRAIFIYINDVLKLRAFKPRFMRAFIDHEYNPSNKIHATNIFGR